MLPILLMSPEPPSFIARTASTASSRTSVELAHVSGSSRDAENTTFDARVSSSTDASSSPVTHNPKVAGSNPAPATNFRALAQVRDLGQCR
jgi:hypothetical protein